MTPFEAIAEPNRRRLLELIGTGERSAGELMAASGLSQPGVSKHLRHLREAGVVRVLPKPVNFQELVLVVEDLSTPVG